MRRDGRGLEFLFRGVHGGGLMASTCWSFGRDWDRKKRYESWFEREAVFKGTCEKCEPYAIGTTNSDINVPPKLLPRLKRGEKRLSREILDEISKLLGAKRRIYPGAALGALKVIQLSGKIEKEFLWHTVTPILREPDFGALKKKLPSGFAGRELENLETHDVLLELEVMRLDLDVFFPETKCALCGKPDTDAIRAGAIEEAIAVASSGKCIYEIPRGHLLVDERFKNAVEGLGLKNASFTEFSMDDYLLKFARTL